ncbi:MAG: hypothetical protein PHT29_03620 [Eubacteriales bacterium]|jgi:hypothetical protein|nr:hypothetical protein [Eubacteriales bacterium]MDD3289954.1 hypothetical protein [Eubacteriales bacterium]MDD3863903.1 hypothetical protein [Eubacteriales bacterium]MDD4444965.1 hypothetical protein [Eubacteriales bacterium]
MDEMDVLGLSVEDALRILEQKSIVPVIRYTGSDEPVKMKANQRVVQLSDCGEQWMITVCSVPDVYR